MNESAESLADDCVTRMLSDFSSSEFGFRVQALAAHLLMRLGHEIIAVNQSGHPDIISVCYGIEHRFEVEAEVSAPRPRQLTDADFDALTGQRGIRGYFALAISFPAPRWIVVPVSKIQRRTRPSPNALLQALSDKDLSDTWSQTYVEILSDRYNTILRAPSRVLRQWALNGISL